MKKTLVTFIMMTLILASWVTNVQALSFTVTLKPSATVVEKGGTVEVVVALSSIDAGSGINSFLATLEYDKNIFETLTTNNDHVAQEIEGLNNWDTPLLNENKGKMVTDRKGFAKDDMDALKIKLKVKANASTGSTTITIKDISASNGQQDINAQNASCTVTIKEKSETPNPNPDDNTTATKPTATVSYETVSNGTKVIIKSNSTLKQLAGWELSSDKKQLSKVYTANYKETISITDENGNISDPITIDVKVTSGDNNNGGTVTIKPSAKVSYEKVSNGTKVTITSTSKLKALTGWELSSDRKQLTKTYTSDYSGTITITDENGNVSNPITIDTKLGNSAKDTTKPTASVKYTKDTKGVVTVTITASEQIQAVTGWTLSADKKTLTKQYTKNTTETITIVDLAGNKSEAIKIEVDTSLSNGGKDFGTGNNNGSNGTKSPDSLPKAGVGFILPVIAIITVVGAVAFVRYKSMEY